MGSANRPDRIVVDKNNVNIKHLFYEVAGEFISPVLYNFPKLAKIKIRIYLIYSSYIIKIKNVNVEMLVSNTVLFYVKFLFLGNYKI